MIQNTIIQGEKPLNLVTIQSTKSQTPSAWVSEIFGSRRAGSVYTIALYKSSNIEVNNKLLNVSVAYDSDGNWDLQGGARWRTGNTIQSVYSSTAAGYSVQLSAGDVVLAYETKA